MTTISYKVQGKSLYIWSEDVPRNRIDFLWPIGQVLPFKDTLVVMVAPDPGSNYNENVFGVRRNCEIAWQIRPREYIYEDSPFTGMKKVGQNVYLSNWDGTELFVNPSTGEIVYETYGR